jgi:hypothetical protein
MSDVIVEIDGTRLDLNGFAKRVVESTIRGVLSPLRGYKEGKITIVIKNGGDTEI